MEPVVVVAVIAMIVVLGVVLVRIGMTTARSLPAPAPSPVRTAERTKASCGRQRAAECDRIETSVRASSVADIEDDHFSGFETLAVDVWRDQDFTLRHRAVGLGWIPFVGKPEHHETPEITRGRLERAYRLNDAERNARVEMTEADGGRIAAASAIVAARIYEHPVWHSGLFDNVHSRVDLVEEVTYLVTAAKELRDHLDIAEPPAGLLASDPEVVDAYVQKSKLLQDRLDALLERLRAPNELRLVVARLQVQSDKNQWLNRVSAIDDVDTAAGAVADSLYAIDMRDRAKMAEASAAIWSGGGDTAVNGGLPA